MTTPILVIGILIALPILGYGVFKILCMPMARQWPTYPLVFPYISAAGTRKAADTWEAQVKRGEIPAENFGGSFFETMRSVKASDYKRLRDVYLKMDKLPTVRKGLKALGIKSMFDIDTIPFSEMDTPYTNKMQRPYYYIPGAPAQEFYDPYEFEWAEILEKAYPVIKEELMNLLSKDGKGFNTYIGEGDKLIEGWNTFNFYYYGKKFEENCNQCPKTTAIIEGLPRFETDHIMFSALNPKTATPMHFGPMNGIIRAHLPLIVPEGCTMYVGDKKGHWEEGKMLVFDDSFYHGAENTSDKLRVVLFLNFWHPCFLEEEIPVLEEFRRAYEQHPIAKKAEEYQHIKRESSINLNGAT